MVLDAALLSTKHYKVRIKGKVEQCCSYWKGSQRAILNYGRPTFISFSKVISPNVNVIARQEFELAYFEAEAQRFVYYSTRTLVNFDWLVCSLVGWFYGISAIVGYFMPNPFLYIETVLFQTIQFSISTAFCLHIVKCQNSSISTKSVPSLVLFDR